MKYNITIAGTVALVFLSGCQTTRLSSFQEPADLAPSVKVSKFLEDSEHGAEGDQLSVSDLPPVVVPASVRTVGHQEPDDSMVDELLMDSAEEQPALEPALEPGLEGELVLDDLEAMALENNPAIAEAAARVEAARGVWLQVGLPPNPVAGYSGQQLGSGGLAEQQGVFIGQEFVTGKKLPLARKVAAWELQQRENDFEATRLRVLTDVRIAYYNVLIAQRRLELTDQLVRISTRGAEAAETLFRGQEVSEADPLRARVEADAARIIQRNAINQQNMAWRQLAAVLGTPEMPMQPVSGVLPTDGLELIWQQELDRLMSGNPELAAAMAGVEAAQWAVQRECAQVIPNLEVQTVVQDDRGTGSSNFNLQVTLPLPIVNRNQGAIRRARADVITAQKTVERLMLDLQSRLAETFQRYENARNQVEMYSGDNGIISKAEKTLKLIRIGYQAGEFSVLELLTAQRTYFETNLAYLDSLQEQLESAMEIRGMLLNQSLSQSP